ncbi:MAG: tetraacyldisaccharide 4'-kinase [Rhodoferax sp.]|nr:tetraacyldisaccharide 4'-kinase [Rhodoferax sp.]
MLWPVSLLYAGLSGARTLLYRNGWRPSRRIRAVVVVVGNVVAGGAGKTPTVAAIVNHLKDQNLEVGIVSRGYGRAGSVCLEVRPDSDVRDVGDEPLLLRKATGVPVFVGKSRLEAAQALLAKHCQTQIIVCDDGLQHYGLYRDIELCVFDDRGCGNGWLVPAGPLREHWPRRSPGSNICGSAPMLVLHTGAYPAFGGYRARRSLATEACSSDGSRVTLESLQLPDSKPIVAIAGIGQPESFFAMLRDRGLDLVQTIALPDHFAYNSLPDCDHSERTLLCTEKDAIKLWRLAPSALAVPLEMNLESGFFTELDKNIADALAAKLSSAHGYKTS